MLLYRSAVMLLFQSTLPREERPYPLVSYLINLLFQSTLPREERLCQRIINMVLGYFNPRSHERSDGYVLVMLCSARHFNPRSHERSDSVGQNQPKPRQNFNPRSHERSDDSYVDVLGGLK